MLGSTKNKITEHKNRENVRHLEITEVVLIHCNFVNNDYQQDSRVLYTFDPSKQFRILSEISPTNSTFLRTCSSEFSYIEVWFIYQKSQALETGDRINLKLTCTIFLNLVNNPPKKLNAKNSFRNTIF